MLKQPIRPIPAVFTLFVKDKDYFLETRGFILKYIEKNQLISNEYFLNISADFFQKFCRK